MVAGAYDRVSDPSVAYDAAHNVWLVSSFALLDTPSGPSGRAVLTSRSTDGGLTWGNPVNTAVARRNEDLDKNWIVCDNTPSSPFYGSCYTQFDDFGHGNALKMYYSRDGGLTWTASRVPRAGVIGGQPVVLPNGNVVVPIDNASETALGYTVSTDGGVRFGQAFVITSISAADDPGNIRSGPLPSAEISGDGKIYVVWEDCRFRAGCPTAGTLNDLVYVTSTNGTTWSAVQRIPIDPVTSTVDHFIPGVAVDKATSGGSIHVGVAYYFYPNTSCTFASCQLSVGYLSSTNGGSSWSAPTQLAGPMTMSWTPNTSQGRMVGDYISTSFGSTKIRDRELRRPARSSDTSGSHPRLRVGVRRLLALAARVQPRERLVRGAAAGAGREVPAPHLLKPAAHHCGDRPRAVRHPDNPGDARVADRPHPVRRGELRVAALLPDAELITRTHVVAAWASRRNSATIVYWLGDGELEVTLDDDLEEAIRTIVTDIAATARVEQPAVTAVDVRPGEYSDLRR